MLFVLIVDASPIVRQGLRLVLDHRYRHVTYGEAQSIKELSVQLAKRLWNLVFIDISPPGNAQTTTLAEIHRRCPSARILAMSSPSDAQAANRARQLGADSYIGEDLDFAEFLTTVDAVLYGGSNFHGWEGVDDARTVPADSSSLSHREHTVLLTLAGGRSATEIARELNLSIKTISTYKRRILTKLRLHTLADIVRYVIDHDLSGRLGKTSLPQ